MDVIYNIITLYQHFELKFTQKLFVWNGHWGLGIFMFGDKDPQTIKQTNEQERNQKIMTLVQAFLFNSQHLRTTFGGSWLGQTQPTYYKSITYQLQTLRLDQGSQSVLCAP